MCMRGTTIIMWYFEAGQPRKYQSIESTVCFKMLVSVLVMNTKVLPLRLISGKGVMIGFKKRTVLLNVRGQSLYILPILYFSAALIFLFIVS